MYNKPSNFKYRGKVCLYAWLSSLSLIWGDIGDIISAILANDSTNSMNLISKWSDDVSSSI